MNRGQMLAAAGGLIAAAVVGGTLISAAFAAPAGPSSSGTNPAALGNGEYCEIYLDALAGELGVDRAVLGAASKAAMNAVVDAALEDGEIDEGRATELRERIAELDDDACEAFRAHILGRGPGHGGRALGHFRQALGAAATALGMERGEVVDAFREGTTLEELAESQGVAYETVTAAVTSAVEAQLDDAVADEDITRERADDILERVTDWLAEGGEPFRRGGHRGGGPFGG